MTKVYISAPVPKKALAIEIAEILRCYGIRIVSTWFEQEVGYDRSDFQLEEAARSDMEELREADVVVMLSYPGSKGGTPGELAAAIALNKKVIAVGDKSANGIFCYHPDVQWVDQMSLVSEVIAYDPAYRT